MNRFLFSLLCLTFLLASQVQAQFSSKAELFGGITYQFVGINPLGSPNTSYSAHYGLGLGFDYVLAHSNDQVSLGINPNVNVCLQFDNLYGLSFFGNVPAYMLARVGAGSTPFNEQKVGIGAGIGGTFSYLSTSYSSGSSAGAFRTSFLNPGAIVEFQLKTRGSNYLFRFNWSLLKPTQEVDLGSIQKYSVRMGVTGIAIFYSF